MKKKSFFIIIVVTLFVVIGFGISKNIAVASEATIGQQLTSHETGWQRIDDSDSRIKYIGGNWKTHENLAYFKGGMHFTGVWGRSANGEIGEYALLKCKTTRLRIIAEVAPTSLSSEIIVKVDEVEKGRYTHINSLYNQQTLVCEIVGLEEGMVHTIKIINNTNIQMEIDAIDIDDNGELFPEYESISLNKASMHLIEGASEQLTAISTPANAAVTWISSDESITTVDAQGNVTAIKEGQAIITAQIKDTDIKTTCEVNVANKEVPSVPETGDGTLRIEMVDGNIKEYNLSDTEIANFIQWYKDRDRDKTVLPIYEFKKGENKEYLVSDKIVGFEIR